MKKLLPLLLLSICFNVLQAQTWTELGGTNTGFSNLTGTTSGFPGQIADIVVDKKGNLYAVGSFGDINSGNKFVAKWNGSSWTELGDLGQSTITYTPYDITNIAVDNTGNVYISFTPDQDTYYVFKYSGGAWNSLGNNSIGSAISALAIDSAGNLYAGVTSYNNTTGTYYDVLLWNGASWISTGFNSTTGEVLALATDNLGNIYAGGGFTDVNDNNYVAVYNANTASAGWNPLGKGANALNANSSINTITVDDTGYVYAGGDFSYLNSGYQYVAKYNGTTWSELGAGANALKANADILTIAIGNNGVVYAAGEFTNALSETSGSVYVAQWNKTSWSPLGGTSLVANPSSNANGYDISSIAIGTNDSVYVGGAFTDANGNFYVGLYTPPLPPTVTSPVTLCQGILHPSPLTASGSGTLNWYGTNATGGTASATAPTPSVSNTGTTTYYLSQTINGIESPRAAIVVIINPSPSGNIAGPNTPTGGFSGFNICEVGPNAIGSAIISTPYVPGYTYQWNYNTYYSSDSSSNVPIPGATNNFYEASPSADQNQNYSVIVTSTNGCKSNGNNNISIKSVSGPFTFSSDTNVTISSLSPAIFCKNGNTTLMSTVPSIVVSDTLTFKWYNAGGSIGADSSATDSVTYYNTKASGNYYVSYEVGSASGTKCYFSSPVIKITEDVVTATVAPPVTTTICSGDSIKLFTTNVSGIGKITYQWYQNAGVAISGATNASYAAPVTSGSSYYLTTIDSANCSDISDTTTITVKPLPPALTTVTHSSSKPYCSGQVKFTIGDTTSGYTYQWYNGDTALSGATNYSYLAQNPGIYSVSAVSGGCPSKPLVADTVFQSPPKIPLVQKGVVPICQGDSILITADTNGIVFNGAAYARWYFNGTVIPGTMDVITHYAKTPGNYTIVLTGNDSCATPSDTATIKTESAPTIAPTISGPTSVCKGDSVTLTANNATGFPIQWYRNGTKLSGDTNSTYTFTAGLITYNYTVTIGLAACSLASTATTVTINPLPATPTLQANGTTTFCPNGNVTLAASSTTSGVTYQWYKTDTAIVGATGSNYNATDSGSYTVVAISAAPQSCPSVMSAPISTTLYNVPGPPTVTSPDSLTQGITPSALTATGSSILWYTVPVGGSGSSVAPIPSVTDTGKTYYYVSQSVNGCESLRDTIIVIVSPGVPLPTLYSDSLTYCINATPSSLLEDVINGDSLSLKWYNTATGGTSIAVPKPSATNAGTTYYYVSQIIKGKESQRLKMAVTVINQTVTAPVITPSGEGTTCDNIILEIPPVDTTDITSYVWKLNNGLILDTLKNQYMPVTDGSYTVTITLQNGCTATSAPYQISPNVNSTPVIINDSGSVPPFMVCTTKASAAKITYQWYADDKVIVGADSAKFPLLYNATYNVAVTYFTTDTCRFNSLPDPITNQKQDLRQTSFFNNSPNSVVITAPNVVTIYNFSAYPNPAKDKLNISYSGGNSISIKLYNTLGEAVLTTEQSSPSGNYQLELPLSYVSGLYILSLTDGGHTQTQKIIIE